VQIRCKTSPKLHPIFVEILVPIDPLTYLESMAGTTGLEPATSAVTVTD